MFWATATTWLRRVGGERIKTRAEAARSLELLIPRTWSNTESSPLRCLETVHHEMCSRFREDEMPAPCPHVLPFQTGRNESLKVPAAFYRCEEPSDTQSARQQHRLAKQRGHPFGGTEK